ncbi:MAG TPA: hypothetical protein VGO48_04945 [Conexibacter sp.]|nr:hypothetical protein [Conexibacter sp.]
MSTRMPNLFAVGSYLTDGTTLLGVVGELPQDRSLRLVENCRTLEVSVVSVDALQARGVQPVAA